MLQILHMLDNGGYEIEVGECHNVKVFNQVMATLCIGENVSSTVQMVTLFGLITWHEDEIKEIDLKLNANEDVEL